MESQLGPPFMTNADNSALTSTVNLSLNYMQALTSYQYLEETLRETYGMLMSQISNMVKPKYPFNPDLDALHKESLGTLIGRFAQVCDDADLIDNLRLVPKKRNRVAHSGLLHHQTLTEPELAALTTEAQALIQRVFAFGNQYVSS